MTITDVTKIMEDFGYKVVSFPCEDSVTIWFQKQKTPYTSQIRADELMQIIAKVKGDN